MSFSFQNIDYYDFVVVVKQIFRDVLQAISTRLEWGYESEGGRSPHVARVRDALDTVRDEIRDRYAWGMCQGYRVDRSCKGDCETCLDNLSSFNHEEAAFRAISSALSLLYDNDEAMEKLAELVAIAVGPGKVIKI